VLRGHAGDSLGKQLEVFSPILLRETFQGFEELGAPIA
jgi:hypothetical protein